MNIRLFVNLLVFAPILLTQCNVSQETAKPNILFLLVDDLGWADVGYQGNKEGIVTPNINNLSKEGLVFTDAYAASPVCSPTRASIVTGKYPVRLQLTSHIPSMGKGWDWGRPKNNSPFNISDSVASRNWLPLEEETIGEVLQKLGYRTGYFGKWHLGHEPYHPDKQGFDIEVGTANWGQPPSYYAPYRRNWPGDSMGYVHIRDLAANALEDEYLTDRLTKEAGQFIRNNVNLPWFCFLSYYTVHLPHEARPDLLEKYKDPYRAMIAGLDESVGKLLALLSEEGLDRQTIVVLMSDNGGQMDNTPLRDRKGSTYEGGIRVPMIIKWPGVTSPGSTCHVPVISNDFYPTFMEMGGGDPDSSSVHDGLSLVPLLRGATSLPREALYWYWPHRGRKRTSTIRNNDWKLIQYINTNEVELYNIREDIEESRNLASSNTAKADELLKLLEQWRLKMNVRIPPSESKQK